MTVLVPTVSRPLTRQIMDDMRKPLFRLFAGYPEPFAKGDTEDLRRLQAEVYMLALDGIPEWAATEAVTAFIQGRVERKASDRLPTAEQLAKQCRIVLEAEAEAQKARRQALQRAQEAKVEQERAATRLPQEERARRANEIMARAGLRQMPQE